MTSSEGAIFSDALGVLSRSGPKWRNMALQLAVLDRQGKINIDNEKCSSQNWVEKLMGVPNDAIAMTTDGKISLHDTLFQEVFPDGTAPRRTERLKNAVRLASVLAHELSHWNAGHAHGIKTTEVGMYDIEREFGVACAAYEYDHGAERSRIDAVYEIAQERESAGYDLGVLSGRSWFK